MASALCLEEAPVAITSISEHLHFLPVATVSLSPALAPPAGSSAGNDILFAWTQVKIGTQGAEARHDAVTIATDEHLDELGSDFSELKAFQQKLLVAMSSNIESFDAQAPAAPAL